MARSKRYVNFTLSLTPSGGTLTAYNEITGYQVHRGKKQLMAFGDAKLYPTLIVNVENSRTITIVGGDVSKLLQLGADTVFTVVLILNDAKNGSGSGALTVTLVDATIAEDSHSGQNNEFGQSSVTFVAYSTDGTTDPLTVSEAA